MNIGLIAHDAKKKINAEFLYRLSWNTQQTQFVCSETSGALIESA